MEGYISNVKSESGIFSLLFDSKYGSTYYTTSHSQIYQGFGYLINIGNKDDIINSRKSAKVFTSFITSLMKFYKTNDLLHLGGNVEKTTNGRDNFK